MSMLSTLDAASFAPVLALVRGRIRDEIAATYPRFAAALAA